MVVSADEVAWACSELGVSEVGSLQDGTQKTVRLVELDGARYVLKVVSLDGSEISAQERAAREVALLADISSPHVVGVRSPLLVAPRPLAAAAWLEEYLDGHDVRELFGTQWGWAETRQMMLQLATGLAQMHDRNVVHRDLSPNNVRRRVDGTYAVMDPGYAYHELLSRLTIGGHPGTLGYVSPEHLRALPNGPIRCSDVFCVGILGFESLTTKLPILANGTGDEYLQRLARCDIGDLGAERPDLDPTVHALFRRVLHPQPARRFRHARDLARALEDLGD